MTEQEQTLFDQQVKDSYNKYSGKSVPPTLSVNNYPDDAIISFMFCGKSFKLKYSHLEKFVSRTAHDLKKIKESPKMKEKWENKMIVNRNKAKEGLYSNNLVINIPLYKHK